ncbi:MAG: glutamate decarboxylase [Desulfitibacter sp. BRH_c19]|nr:MAG: glutamate decarboxylase [Desulfitibacter sp. BRH_c19]
MWTVVYIAQNKTRAEKLKDALIAEGLLVNLRGLGNDSDNVSKAVEILVPESEAEEAHEIINNILSI